MRVMRRWKRQNLAYEATVAVVGDEAAPLPQSADDATLTQTLSRLAREQIVVEPQGRWRQPELSPDGAFPPSMRSALLGCRVATEVIVNGAALRRDLRAEWQRKTGRPAR